MSAEFSQALPLDQMKLIVIEQVKETKDITLLNIISQMLLFERRY